MNLKLNKKFQKGFLKKLNDWSVMLDQSKQIELQNQPKFSKMQVQVSVVILQISCFELMIDTG